MARFFPSYACYAHIECLDIQRAVPEWIVSQILVKILVDEHPVKRGVKGDEYRFLVRRRIRAQPTIELPHGFLRRKPIFSQGLERQPADFESL